jgi:ATP-binding protein involved in chromosome partitioning
MGVVENMSHFECPKCGHQEHVFGEDISHKLEFLGKDLKPFARIPLHMDVR